MASVTKTYTSVVRGVSIATDGQITVGIGWLDTVASSDPQKLPIPTSVTNVRIANGKVFVQGLQEISAASDQLGKDAAALANNVKALIESLITSGKIIP